MPSEKPIFPNIKLNQRGYYHGEFYAYQRHLPQPLPVHHIYYCPARAVVREWPQGSTGCFAVSFILQGAGMYQIFGKTWRVQAPCILTQWPGIPLRFGPETSWEELSIDYAAGLMPRLQRWKIASKRRPIWPMAAPFETRQYLNLLYPLLAGPAEFGQADRLDSLCLHIITDTMLRQAAGAQPDKIDAAIQAIEKSLANNVAHQPDFASLASAHGLAYSTFRRVWSRIFALPPAQYVQHIKIKEACRLLRETDLTITAIAARLNFCDSYYFSKQFHRATGVPPRAFRRQNPAAPRES